MILDQFGREIRTMKAPERRPLAAAPVLDTWREYVSAGLTPRRLTTLLKEADAGNVQRQAELFDQMEEKDAHLLGEAEKRRNAILDVEFEVTPASEDSRDVHVAEFVQEYFDNMGDWDDSLAALQDSVGKGFSVLEIHWDTSSGQAMPKDLAFIEQKRFLFTDPAGYLRTYPRLISDDNMMGEEIPPWKILFHRYGGKAGHAARSGIYRVCAWMFLFRNYSFKDWMGFLEVFGMPLRLGKYDTAASTADKDALITAIQSLGSDAAGIISKDTEIEFIEAVKHAGAGNPYETMLHFCGKEISKALLGQTLTADVEKTGSYAASKTHNEVRLDLAKADTRSVGATVRYQLIRPLVGFNFGWDTPTPGYTAQWKEQEDLKALSEVYKNVIGFGQPVSAEHVSERFGIPLPEKDQTILRAVSGPLPMKQIIAKSGQFSPEQHQVEGLVAEAVDRAVTAASGLREPLKKMIAGAKSLEDLRDTIYAAYGDLDGAQLQELVARAIYIADLYGRFTAQR